MDAVRANTIFLPARQIIIAAMLAAIKPTTVCNGRLRWLWAARAQRVSSCRSRKTGAAGQD